MSTYVLVHGAYQGGWIWRPVAERLRRAGHDVFCPTLDGCGERHSSVRPGITTETHGEDVARLLFYEDLSDVVLVGTSSGGMVVCRAAEQARDRIEQLVFVDALALESGEKVPDIVGPPSGATEAHATGPTRSDAENRLFADLEPGLRSWALDRMTRHPVAALQQPVSLDSFWKQSWSAAVIYCRRSQNPPEAHQRRTAERLHATWAELDTGHYPMLSTPDELTSLLLAAQP